MGKYDNREYAVYKGDDLLAIGTVSELAKALDIKESTVKWYLSPKNNRLAKETPTSKVFILIEYDEDEDDYYGNPKGL